MDGARIAFQLGFRTCTAGHRPCITRGQRCSRLFAWTPLVKGQAWPSKRQRPVVFLLALNFLSVRRWCFSQFRQTTSRVGWVAWTIEGLGSITEGLPVFFAPVLMARDQDRNFIHPQPVSLHSLESKRCMFSR